MPLTAQDRQWFDRQAELTAAENQVRERLCNASFDELNHAGLTPRGDDRAASLEAAIIRWLIECRE